MSLIYLFLSFDSMDTTAKLMAGTIASPDTETDIPSPASLHSVCGVIVSLGVTYTLRLSKVETPIGLHSSASISETGEVNIILLILSVPTYNAFFHL